MPSLDSRPSWAFLLFSSGILISSYLTAYCRFVEFVGVVLNIVALALHHIFPLSSHNVSKALTIERVQAVTTL